MAQIDQERESTHPPFEAECGEDAAILQLHLRTHFTSVSPTALGHMLLTESQVQPR